MDHTASHAREVDQAAAPPNVEAGGRPFAWYWVWFTLLVSLAVGVGVTIALWGHTTAEHSSAFDMGWKSAAAVLAILATFVGVDRLRLAQREHSRQMVADQAARDDAVTRQITDLSAKASEQLGSDKAAVRIGGLTDLERLAQTYPELRQTVVERICAYLRAPYQPPPDHAGKESTSKRRPNRLLSPMQSRLLDINDLAESRLELDVRRTAQQILKRHLYWPAEVVNQPSNYWDRIELDLRDAALVELDLQNCRVASADFRNAKFYRTTVFNHAAFTGDVTFQDATFFGRLWFTDSLFMNEALFHGASFEDETIFQRATFSMSAFFNRASFAKKADFNHTIIGDAVFYRTHFGGEVEFGAEFRRNATFEQAVFLTKVNFQDASVDNPGANHKWPHGWRVEPDPDTPRGAHRLRREH